MTRFPPWLGLALAVVSVSFAAPLFRLAEAPALTASLWRLAFAVLLLAPFARAPTSPYSQREWWLIVASGVALALHFGLWVTSLFYTTVAASVSLVTFQAIFVALGTHWILRERIAGRGWLGVAVATVGVITIAATDGTIAPDSARALWGDFLALAGGVGSAVYMLIGRNLRATRGLVEYVMPVYAVAAVALAIMALMFGQPLGFDLPVWTIFVFVLLAAVPMLGGHTLANWCLRYMRAHTVATWILLEPIGAALIAWPLLDEVPHPIVAVGGLLVLAGAMLTVSGERRPPVPPS